MGDIVVRSSYQRIYVDPQSNEVKIVHKGPKGYKGDQGAPGTPNTGTFATNADLAAASAGFDARLDALEVTDTWHNVTYDNGFIDYGADSWTGGQYRMYKRMVQLRGLIRHPSSIGVPVIALTLPEGYRPKDIDTGPGINGIKLFAVETSSGMGHIDISPTGTVNLASGSSSWVALYGISFGID